MQLPDHVGQRRLTIYSGTGVGYNDMVTVETPENVVIVVIWVSILSYGVVNAVKGCFGCCNLYWESTNPPDCIVVTG
jgi:hypothetical protein